MIDIEYTSPLSAIEPLMDAHFEYLKKYYDAGIFIVSGRKEPRTGGMIIVKNADRQNVQSIMEEDPFYSAGVASYKLTEFIPGSVAVEFESLKTDVSTFETI